MQASLVFLVLLFGVTCAIRSSLPQVNQVGRVNVVARYDDVTTDESETKTGIQFMITRKMRNILRDELGYNDDEIDDMEPQIAAVVIEKSLNRPKKGMPASWRRSSSGGGFLESWKSLSLLKRLNSLRKGVQGGLQDAGCFLYEQSQRPIVRSALLVAALMAAREPILQGANAAAQIAADKWNTLTSRRHRVSAYQLTPQYSQRSLKSVLDSQQQPPGFRRDAGTGWLRWPSLSFGRSESSGARLGKLVDVHALSRVQHQSLWDKLSLRVARWKRGW